MPNSEIPKTPPPPRIEGGIHRRRFLVAGAAGLAAGAGLLACSSDDPQPPYSDLGPGFDGPPPPLPARVVEVHDEKALSGTTPDAARVAAMLDKGLARLTGAADARGAWKVLLPDFSPSMRIGLKLNCLSGSLYSSAALVGALVNSLATDLGADRGKILVWDRRTDELTRSKLSSATVGGAQVLGTVTSPSDGSGPGYESAARQVGSGSTRLSKILTQQTDVTINLALLKTHTISGATGALKNVYGCIDNPGDFHDKLNDDLPAIYALEPIRKRLRLHITEALLAVVKGDTADPPDTLGNRLLLSTDPVALDTQATSLINTLRGTRPPLPQAKLAWLNKAAALGLGNPAYAYDLVKISG